MNLFNNWFFQALFFEIFMFLYHKLLSKFKNKKKTTKSNSPYVYSNSTLRKQFYICFFLNQFLCLSYILQILNENKFYFLAFLFIINVFIVSAFEASIDMIEYHKSCNIRNDSNKKS